MMFTHQKLGSSSAGTFSCIGEINGCMLSGTKISGDICTLFAPVNPRKR